MTPHRFRRRPRTVEAVLYDGSPESVDAIHGWLDGVKTMELASGSRGMTLIVALFRQSVEVGVGDWLARDSDGQLHVISAEDLAENYEMEGGG